MAPSRIFNVKRIDLVAAAALCSFPYDVRLDEYALLVKKVLPIKLLPSKASRRRSAYATRSPTATTSARAPSRASWNA